MKFPYRLISTLNGVQKESMGFFHTELQGLKRMNELSKKSIEEVKFPIRLVNNTKIEEAKFELVLIKKRENGDPKTNLVRNDYGEFVEHISDNDMWLIIDKAKFEVEEKFWVYGYHPLTDRKSYDFIFNELVKSKATNKSDFLQIKVYLNKIIIVSSTETNLVICKDKPDAIRLYNLLQSDCEKDKKIKYVCFSGNGNSTAYSREICIDEIFRLTNWNRKKIMRHKTKTQNGKQNIKKI